MIKKYLTNIYLLTLMALVAFHIISNYQYLSISNKPPVMEEYNYLEKIVNYYEIFRSPDLKVPARMKMAQPTANSQAVFCPVYPVLSAVLLLFTGIKDPQLWVCLLHSLFLAVIIFSVFGIGRRLYSPLAGLLAAVVTSTAYFLLISLTRFILADIPAVAFLTLSFYLLLRTEGFSRKWYSLAFGLTWAAAVLTRASVLIFFPAALFLVLFYLFERKFHDPDKIRLKNILLALLGFGLPLLYLGFYWKAFVSFMLSPSVLTVQASLGPQSKFSWESAVYYLKYGLYDYGTVIWLIVFIIGLFFTVIRPRKKNILPLVWFFVGYFMLTFVAGVKEPRYFVPLLPAVALISTAWIEQMRSKNIKYAVSILIVLFSFLFYFVSNWGRGPLARDHRYFKLGPAKILITPYVRPPQNKTANIDALIDLINKDAVSNDIFHPPGLYVNDNINRGNFDSRLRIPNEAKSLGAINVLTLFLDFDINGNLIYKTRFTELKYLCPWVINIPSAYYYDKRDDATRSRFWFPVEFFLQADYIIVKTGPYLQQGLIFPEEERYIKLANKIFDKPLMGFHSDFELLSKAEGSYADSYFLIYKRVKPPSIPGALTLTAEAIKSDPGNKSKYYNTLQSFLLCQLSREYVLPRKSLSHLYESYNVNADVYVWSRRELKGLLAGVPGNIVQKRLLLDMENKVQGYTSPFQVRWEVFNNGRLEGKVAIKDGGEYYLVTEDGGEYSAGAIKVDSGLRLSGRPTQVRDGKFTALGWIELKNGSHSISALVDTGKNILKDGSFEDEKMEAWKVMSSDRGLPGKADVDWKLVNDGTQGNQCLSLISRRHVIGINQGMTVSSGKDQVYLLSLDYKHVSGQAPEILVWESPYEYQVNQLLTLEDKGSGWRSFFTLVEPKPLTKGLTVYLYSKSEGDFTSENRFDNVRLYSLPKDAVARRLWLVKKLSYD